MNSGDSCLPFAPDSGMVNGGGNDGGTCEEDGDGEVGERVVPAEGGGAGEEAALPAGLERVGGRKGGIILIRVRNKGVR